MKNKNPKKRGLNYTESEKELLLSLVHDYSYIIDTKETTSQFLRDKQEAWLHIETRFNDLATTGRRTFVQLRRLYENFKHKARNNLAKETNAEQTKNQGIEMEVSEKPNETEKNIQEIEIEASVNETKNIETGVNENSQTKSSGDDENIKNCNCTDISNQIETIASLKKEYLLRKLKNAKLERTLLIAEHNRRETLFKMKLQLLTLKINNQYFRIKKRS